MKIAQCEERGMTFKEVVAAVEAYIEEQHTYFVLETQKRSGSFLMII